MSYTPQVGHRVIVDFEDLGLAVETIHGVSNDGRFIMLFQGEPGEQCAGCDAKGFWRLEESGQKVFLLDPHQSPERSGIGFVIPADGPVEQWYMDAPHVPGSAEGFLHAEQVSGIAHVQEDGTWAMNEQHPIFFIPEKQANLLTGALVDEEIAAPIVQGGDKFRTVSDRFVEFWDYAGTTDCGEVLIRRVTEDGTEYTRRLEAMRDELERTQTDWRCVDDPGEFDQIMHMPRIAGAEGPEIGDICTRVTEGTVLMYHIRDFEQYDELRIAQLTLTPDILGFYPYAQVSYVPDGGWQWENGDKCTFTSGRTDELARKATRLDAFHAELRAKYFQRESEANHPDRVGTVKGLNAARQRDDYAELLFLAETGLRHDQHWAKYRDFQEALHEEYLASIEK